jgi:hypothetical protein
MKVIINASILLLMICLLNSCSPKLHIDLSRRAIINARFEPIFKKPIEVSDCFYLGLVVKLNNGKVKRKFIEIDESNYIKTDVNYYDEDSYWNQFNIVTYNCIFNNGKVLFNRNGPKIPDFVAVKIMSKNGLTTDSFGIKIPKIEYIKIEYQTNTTLAPSFMVPFNLVAFFNNEKK